MYYRLLNKPSHIILNMATHGNLFESNSVSRCSNSIPSQFNSIAGSELEPYHSWMSPTLLHIISIISHTLLSIWGTPWACYTFITRLQWSAYVCGTHTQNKCEETHFRICANQLSAGLRLYLSSSKSIWATEVCPDSRVSYTFLGEEA